MFRVFSSSRLPRPRGAARPVRRARPRVPRTGPLTITATIESYGKRCAQFACMFLPMVPLWLRPKAALREFNDTSHLMFLATYWPPVGISFYLQCNSGDSRPHPRTLGFMPTRTSRRPRFAKYLAFSSLPRWRIAARPRRLLTGYRLFSTCPRHGPTRHVSSTGHIPLPGGKRSETSCGKAPNSPLVTYSPNSGSMGSGWTSIPHYG